MEKFKIISPSYKRAGVVTTHNYFDDVIYLVPESQEKDYIKKTKMINNVKIETLPDELDGNIAKKRNYILDNYKGNIVMLDDDYKGLYVMNSKFIPRHGRKMKKDEFKVFVNDMFIMCNDMNLKLWGTNLNKDPLCYRTTHPFSFLSPVLGQFIAVINDDDFKIRYDERLYLREDYDFFLQNINVYGRAMRVNFIGREADTFDKGGGCQSYRTMEKEKEQSELLIKKWGSRTVKMNKKRKDYNVVLINVPLKGV